MLILAKNEQIVLEGSHTCAFTIQSSALCFPEVFQGIMTVIVDSLWVVGCWPEFSLNPVIPVIFWHPSSRVHTFNPEFRPILLWNPESRLSNEANPGSRNDPVFSVILTLLTRTSHQLEEIFVSPQIISIAISFYPRRSQHSGTFSGTALTTVTPLEFMETRKFQPRPLGEEVSKAAAKIRDYYHLKINTLPDFRKKILWRLLRRFSVEHLICWIFYGTTKEPG